MLQILASRLEREPRTVRDNVTLHEGDMRSFHLNKKFPLVIIPFRPMQHMYTVPDQLAALATAAAHLEENGKAFDVFYPKFEAIPAGIGQEILELEWSDASNPPKTVRRFLKKKSFDKIHQTFAAAFIFRTYQVTPILRRKKPSP